MGIRENIAEWLAGDLINQRVVEAQVQASRAYESGYFDGLNGNDDPPSGDLATFGYRRITSKGLRDFTKVEREKALETAWTLFQSSPIAARLMHIKRDHIVGSNPTIECDDEELLKITREFWERNKLDERISEFAMQLFLLGEQCYPTVIRNSDGRAIIGYFDPNEIKTVVCHPLNPMEDFAVVLNPIGEDTESPWLAKNEKHRVFRIVREATGTDENGKYVKSKYEGRLVTHDQATLEDWEEDMLKHYKLTEYSGSCFFAGVNRVSNMTRGYSDLLRVADFIDLADEVLFSLGEREQFLSYFSWFVKVMGVEEGSDQWNKIVTRVISNPPSKGSVNITNENEEWKLQTADIKQHGSIAAFEAILGMIAAGMGYPLSWLGFGDQTNRSTLDKQADPTEKTLEHDQGVFKRFIDFIFRFVRDQAIIAGMTGISDGCVATLKLPVINQQNIAEAVVPLVQAVQAAVTAQDSGNIQKLTGTKIIAKIANEIGVEINPETELQDADDQTDDDIIDVESRQERLIYQLNGNGKTAAV